MKHLDIDKVFDIVLGYDYQPQTNDEVSIICAVFKAVEDFDILDVMYARRYGQPYILRRDIIKMQYYSKLVKHLMITDVLHSDTVNEVLCRYPVDTISYILNQMIDCFIIEELYEYCAVIQKFMNIFNVKNLQCTD